MADAPKTIGYLAFVDGLRAIAVMQVLANHRLGPISWALSGPSGWIGVDTFFVISGFLITSLLVQEQNRSGTIDIKAFFIRRWLRIAPAFYTYLILSFAYFAIRFQAYDPASFCICAFYVSDFVFAAGAGSKFALLPIYTPTWSLGIEEKFYLCVPLIIKKLKTQFLPFAISLFFLCQIWKVYLLLHGANWMRIQMSIDTHCDSLLLGCIAAVVAVNGTWDKLASKLPKLMPEVMLLAFTIVSITMPAVETESMMVWCVLRPLQALATALLILLCLSNRTSLAARALSLPFAVWIGKLSYSLYLWHPVTIGQWAPLDAKVDARLLELIKLLTTFTFAALSYYFVEKPFLRMKNRFARTSPAIEPAAKPI